jgi:hypothetical protein
MCIGGVAGAEVFGGEGGVGCVSGVRLVIAVVMSSVVAVFHALQIAWQSDSLDVMNVGQSFPVQPAVLGWLGR